MLVRERSLDRLDDATATCAAALADAGAIAVREDVNLEPAFWGQFPGNEQYLVRRALISSANMASFGSLHGFALGKAEGNHWGDAVTLLETTSATPFFFNFHHGDLGNFSVIGPSGSGKTVVMNFLAAQAQKFARARSCSTRIAAPNCSSAASAGAMTGSRRASRPGSTRSRCPTAPTNRAFLRDWLAVLLKAEGPEELATIAAAVDAAYANDAGAAPPAPFPRTAVGLRAGRSRATWPTGSRRGSRAANTPGCSTTRPTGSTCRPACSAST